MARLIISSPDGKKGFLELSKAVTTMGRGNANDLVLNDPSVSRFHAVLKLKAGAVAIADRGSTNGIHLNGRRILQETELRSGDVARVGRYELRLENGEEGRIQVRRGEWPSTLNQIMRGHTGQVSPPLPREIAGQGKAVDLAGRVRKLERENYLLQVLFDAGRALNSKLSIDDISEHVISLAFRIECVERGFVMLFDENGHVSRQSHVRYRNPGDSVAQPKFIL